MFLLPYIGSEARQAAQKALESLDPFDQIDRIFSSFAKDSSSGAGRVEGVYWPALNVSEDEQAYQVEAELPGLDEKDVEVSLASDTLTIRGEKRRESEDKTKKYIRRESTYGNFQRQLSFPVEIDADKIEASFKNGLLSGILPKSKKAKDEVRKIAVKTA